MTILLVRKWWVKFGGMRFCSVSSFRGQFVPCGWDRTKGVALHLWSWQNASGEGRSDGKNAGGCRSSYFTLPVEDVFFPSPSLPTSFSKFSNIALCGSLRYSFQGNTDIQTDGTLHMLRHPKYKLLIEFLFAEGAFRSCLFTLCEMAQCPHMQTGNIPAWLLS